MKNEWTIKPQYGLYVSYDMNNTKLITSLTRWECDYWTERYLRGDLDGGNVVNNGTVGGKLWMIWHTIIPVNCR